MPAPHPAVLAPEYVTLVARAYAASRGDPEPPAARTQYVTLFKLRAGVAVQADFRRVTPTRFPELRVGVWFRGDETRAARNAAAAEAFAARFAAELAALGCEPWPSETNTRRRFTTPLPIPRPGEDTGPFAARAAELARAYAELLGRA
jgi:hypothetical protein